VKTNRAQAFSNTAGHNTLQWPVCTTSGLSLQTGRESSTHTSTQCPLCHKTHLSIPGQLQNTHLNTTKHTSVHLASYRTHTWIQQSTPQYTWPVTEHTTEYNEAHLSTPGQLQNTHLNTVEAHLSTPNQLQNTHLNITKHTSVHLANYKTHTWIQRSTPQYTWSVTKHTPEYNKAHLSTPDQLQNTQLNTTKHTSVHLASYRTHTWIQQSTSQYTWPVTEHTPEYNEAHLSTPDQLQNTHLNTTKHTSVHLASYRTHNWIQRSTPQYTWPVTKLQQPFNSLFSRTTWVSQYQKGKNQSGFYWSKRRWVAVASAGPYASLHLAPDR